MRFPDGSRSMIETHSPVWPEATRRMFLAQHAGSVGLLALAALLNAQRRGAAAETALANGRDPRDEELQPTISNPDNNGKPNAAGIITGRSGLVVCSKDKNPDGSQRIVCPAISVPNEEYPKRVKELEDAVARAEEEVRRAGQAYRRDGPD